MNKPNIVVIDDDQVFREVLSKSLTRLGCQAVHFEHPKMACETIEKFSQVTVLLDLKLELDSGLRWIEKIKQANTQCRLLLLTGYASISTAVEAIKLGADDYLAKPLTARQLLEHIQSPTIGCETPISEKPMSVDRLEWEHIQKVLQDNQGNVSASARALGMHRRTLQRKLAKRPVKS